MMGWFRKKKEEEPEDEVIDPAYDFMTNSKKMQEKIDWDKVTVHTGLATYEEEPEEDDEFVCDELDKYLNGD